MPYIARTRRAEVVALGGTAKTAGELNFQVTDLLVSFLAYHGVSYETYNTVVGVLESAKLEFYRRQIAFYEDEKLRENGDVYG